MQLIHVSGILLFLIALGIVTVHVAVVGALGVLVFFPVARLCQLGEIRTAKVHRALHVVHYGCFLVIRKFLVVHYGFGNVANVIVCSHVDGAAYPFPHFRSKKFSCPCVRLVHIVLHGQIVRSTHRGLSGSHQSHGQSHTAPNVAVELSGLEKVRSRAVRILLVSVVKVEHSAPQLTVVFFTDLTEVVGYS